MSATTAGAPPAEAPASSGLPFANAKLDALLGEAGIDLLVVTSKHNLRYLLGGYHHAFFAVSDAIGISRYLPVLLYWPGQPDRACYVANRNERDAIEMRAREGRPLWPPRIRAAASTSLEAATVAAGEIKAGGPPRRIAIEAPFLPADAWQVLRHAFPEAEFVEALRSLERLRAVKSPAELTRLRSASERVVDAMIAVMEGSRQGTTKRQLVEALRREEAERGLVFEYALVTVGTDFNRVASEDRWMAGDILSLDSGGHLDGYVGDLCRMAVLGEPDSELEDLLGEVRAVQDAARAAIRPGQAGGDTVQAGRDALAASTIRPWTQFVAHGMGMIGHEAPRVMADGPIPYPGDDRDRPLEAGMVLSVETTLAHPRRGFIKLEDTVAVTAEGHEGFGDRGRGWTRGGTA